MFSTFSVALSFLILYIVASAINEAYSMLQEIAVRTPKAIITQALYSKLLGLQRNDAEADLGVDLASEDLHHLFARFTFNFKQPPGLNHLEDFKLLRQEFAIALRHRQDQYELCFEVAKQSLEKGIPYVTFGVSPAARLLKEVCKEVIVEVNRAKSLRFSAHPQSHSIYWTEYDITHDTADLILRYFSKRYPMRILLIYSRRMAYWWKNSEAFSEEINKFSLANIDKKFAEEPVYRRVAH